MLYNCNLIGHNYYYIIIFILIYFTEDLPSHEVASSLSNNLSKKIDQSVNFTIASPNTCSETPIHVLVWIFSAPKNFERRKIIRKTYAKPSLFLPLEVRFVFSVALITKSMVTQRKILKEQNAYGDIVQDGTFQDAYGNLTHKVIIFHRLQLLV